jgi:hypothetical protein
MTNIDPDGVLGRTRRLDLTGIDFDAVRDHPLPAEALRALHYMQDVESHTIVYLRELASTTAIDEPGIGTFLACWLFEETFHGRAIRRFLDAAGHPAAERARSRAPLRKRIESTLTTALSRHWPDFVAVHMTWGAINELTTLTGYQRLATVTGHPVLCELLARIVRDEARHFGFYYEQARRRLGRPGAARVTRFLVERFWAPVGSGVEPAAETRFLADYLFGDDEGRVAARKVDRTIQALPGLERLPLLEHWIASHAQPTRSSAYVFFPARSTSVVSPARSAGVSAASALSTRRLFT